MWSDNDIDKAFQRINPLEPEPAPFPLDAWLRLETQLDKEEVARTVRGKMWRLFALEVLVVALVGLGWLLWKPADAVAPAASQVATAGASHLDGQQLQATATPRVMKVPRPRTAASAAGISAVESIAAAPAASLAAAKPGTPSDAKHHVASGHNHLESTLGKPALGLVAAIPQRRSLSKRRPAEGQASRSAEGLASRSAAAASLATSGSRRGRRAEDARTWGKRGMFSTASAQSKSRGSSKASSGPHAEALVAVNYNRREAGVQARNVSPVSPEAGEATGATTSTSSADRRTETSSVAADNSELTAKRVTLTPVMGPALPTPLGQMPETPLAVAPKEPRLYIGLVGAPDVTTVKFASVERPLLNLGLTLEYRFANRWRVTTGLLRANKDYYARREDYDWSAYPRAATRNFTWVEGECTVLDVPLNLCYDAVVRDNARWFGSVGLSSFFMHRERYAYDYDEGGYFTEWERSYVNENQHLFSILNLSAGYERSLGRHWRLQAEPYFKLPLGGVGMGKVKLTSAGVFLGVKYGF